MGDLKSLVLSRCAPFSLLFFAVPLGLGNGIGQPIALLLLLPFLLAASDGFAVAALFLLSVLFSSVLAVSSLAPVEHSWYQLARSGLPFSCLVILLAGQKGLYKHVLYAVEFRRESGARGFDRIVTLFAYGRLLQIICFYVGLQYANSSFFSTENGRIFLMQGATDLLLLYYSMRVRRSALALVFVVILLSTGSKMFFVAGLAMFSLTLVYQRSIRELGYAAATFIAIASLAFYASPQSLYRIVEFAAQENLQDSTREWEVSYAKNAFASDSWSMLFGKGFAVALTPGIESISERFTENSKYDIEQGYWSLLAKTGIAGAIFLSCLMIRLCTKTAGFAVVVIFCLLSFGTSGLYIASLDGAFLIVWAAFVAAALEGVSSSINKKSQCSY